MCFIILIGAMIFNYLLAVSRLPSELSSYIIALAVNRYIIIGVIIVIYLVLGCFMSTLAMMVLTVPIFFPVILSLGFNPIWFGVIVTRMTEIAQITPPVGINVFVMRGIAKDVPMGTIFRGIVPFLYSDLVHVVLLVAFPQISLFLPNLMK
jgi:TRAP-type C4-dicarboxylate transport system permease large subunit